MTIIITCIIREFFGVRYLEMIRLFEVIMSATLLIKDEKSII